MKENNIHSEEIEEETEDEIMDEEGSVEEEIDATEQEILDLKNSLSRIQADFINFKNRTQKEKAQSIALANEGLILRLLPVIDDLERALDQKNCSNEFSEGISMIYKNMIEILKGEGLEEVPSVGEPFDPNFHHAVVMEDNDELESNHIIETLQKGYVLNDKVIRPSMVKVSN
ncbi:nucleotide exchange factor GrpE [Gallicola sp. Sow4_E12]|uniref:nucleotide exchange factor GrpE n=1 Tax=Gallicola sp. Sow4_E12 TaxID=3438785 RepID=UPI003F92C36A